MGTLYVNAEAIKELDFTGDDMQRIKEEAAESYSLSYFKKMVTEYAARIKITGKSTEDIASEIAKQFYVDGYMDAISILTDRYSEIIAKSITHR